MMAMGQIGGRRVSGGERRRQYSAIDLKCTVRSRCWSRSRLDLPLLFEDPVWQWMCCMDVDVDVWRSMCE